MHMTRQAGFSLIEVLVAIGIVAMAMMAGMAVSMTLTRFAERQPELVLAQLCAQNEFARLRLQHQFPAIGDTTTTCTQGGREFSVRLSVTATENLDFRQVRTQIQQAGVSSLGAAASDTQQVLLSVSTVIGR
jgi:general secretion pathway protein I